MSAKACKTTFSAQDADGLIRIALNSVAEEEEEFVCLGLMDSHSDVAFWPHARPTRWSRLTEEEAIYFEMRSLVSDHSKEV